MAAGVAGLARGATGALARRHADAALADAVGQARDALARVDAAADAADLRLGQVTPLHGPAHTPPWQVWPAAQVTSTQAFSTQSPLTQVSPGAHGNSLELHWGTQMPRSQTCWFGQVALSSTMPSQSLSTPSQTSALALTDALHFSVVPVTHSLRPAAHTPGMPVSQAVPPPAQVRPDDEVDEVVEVAVALQALVAMLPKSVGPSTTRPWGRSSNPM